MNVKMNLQDVFLNEARKERVPLTVFLTNGFQQRGVITAFDGYTIMLLFEGKQYLIYKHAVSTIIPQKMIELTQN
ncbi:MAG: RNA chaperone Hfq [Clostridia bacterium]|nr:RNA chaperone Hfq [Clostridia bacterium]